MAEQKRREFDFHRKCVHFTDIRLPTPEENGACCSSRVTPSADSGAKARLRHVYSREELKRQLQRTRKAKEKWYRYARFLEELAEALVKNDPGSRAIAAAGLARMRSNKKKRACKTNN